MITNNIVKGYCVDIEYLLGCPISTCIVEKEGEMLEKNGKMLVRIDDYDDGHFHLLEIGKEFFLTKEQAESNSKRIFQEAMNKF